MLAALACLAALLPLGALAQFVTPPSGLIQALGAAGINVRYKVVPTGICESHPNVTSYAVYADIDDNQHICQSSDPLITSAQRLIGPHGQTCCSTRAARRIQRLHL
jgi:hypothetical protein